MALLASLARYILYVYVSALDFASAYCLFLFCISAAVVFTGASKRGRTNEQERIAPQNRFLILIPAHDEELVLGASLSSIAAQNYPSDRVRTILIADNCSDATAEIASAYSRAQVWERRDPELIGKPSALNWALDRLKNDSSFDALVVIDADSILDRDFLFEMNRGISKCRSDLYAAQCYYGVLNQTESWRSALMTGALGLVHYVRPIAREALGLSTGLKGNGMCFSRRLCRCLKWRADSLTEDIELGFDLIERHALRVRFVKDAVLRAQMPITGEQSKSQRLRWEKGRNQIRMQRAWPAFFAGFARMDPVRIDCALDLLIPPVAELAALNLLGAALIGAGMLSGASMRAGLLGIAFSASSLAVYVLGGFALSKAPKKAFAALLAAPFYVPWKIFVVLFGAFGKTMTWKKTKRRAIEIEKDSASDENRDGGGK